MRLTIATLLAVAYLGAQTGKDLPGRKGDTKMPGEPGVMHPLPVPKTTPVPVPAGDAKKAARDGAKKKASDDAGKKKSGDGGQKKQVEARP